jgi:esterase/lipase superfamily enzyme
LDGMQVMNATIEMRRAVASGTAVAAVLFLLMLMLSACASRPGAATLDAHSARAPGARIVTVYLATSRTRVSEGLNRYNDFPSETLNFAEYRISIPATHKPGIIEYPKDRPDPRTDFVVVGEQVLDRAAFMKKISSRGNDKTGDASIFVHGFNTNLPEAIFRRAQLTADMGETDNDVGIVFAWPSTGSISGYLADKASAPASRDQLTDLLTMVTQARPTGDVSVIGHSMGGWLLTEALRQLKLVKRQAVLDRLKVVLAAPDIDGLVFLSQMQVIGRMHEPMTILVSRDDLALSFSSYISQDVMRVGSLDINDPVVQQGASEANVQIIDISGVKSDDSFGHNGFASLAVYYPELKKQEGKDGSLHLNRAGVFVFDAVAKTLTAPFVIGRHIVAGR